MDRLLEAGPAGGRTLAIGPADVNEARADLPRLATVLWQSRWLTGDKLRRGWCERANWGHCDVGPQRVCVAQAFT